MKIKRLEIVGFKSFVDKVSLDFRDGVTGIVGPNGCGKSNIVDAIRWAMGEQSAKNLRGKAMEDVIFGGSESRKPHGMAEVSIVFANTEGLGPPAFREYSEIMVTRRLYRNGDSDYLLNKTPCRLLDIAELFMDTGVGKRAYSIIEQGKIGMILSAKPEDRRFLIEEAAGVTKFKSRKKTATRKIEATKQNLLRLSDIISEVRRQLGSLKRQAQRAEKFRVYRDELKSIETVFAQRRLTELRSTLKDASIQERELSAKLEKQQGEMQQGELRLSESRVNQAAAEKEVSAAQEQVYALGSQIQQVEGQLEFGGREKENLEKLQLRLQSEQQEVAERLSGLDQQESGLDADALQLSNELAAASRILAEAEAELETRTETETTTSQQQEQLRNTYYATLNELARQANLQEDSKRRLELLEERAQRNRQEQAALDIEQQEILRQHGQLDLDLAGAREQRDKLLLERNQAEGDLSGFKQALVANEQELMTGREALNRCRSRLESLQQLERNFEGYGSGVKTLLQENPLKQGFAGMVADLLEVPPECEIAVEAVLGDRLQALLTSDAGHAEKALACLNEKGGRSTLLLQDYAAEPGPEWPGGRHLAAAVKLKAGAPAAVLNLLQGVYLVEAVQSHLTDQLPWGVALVTETGECLTARGELSGGSAKLLGEGLLHKKREMKDLAEQLATLQSQVDDHLQTREDLQTRQRDTDARLLQLAAELHAQELKVAENDKDLLRFQQDNQKLQARLALLAEEAAQFAQQRTELETRLAELMTGHAVAEQAKQVQEQQLAEVQTVFRQQQQSVAEARERLTGLKVQVASLREREESERRSREGMEKLREELRGRQVLLAAQQEESAERLVKIDQETVRQRTALEVLYTRREEERKRYDTLRDGFEELNGTIINQEEALRQLRVQIGQQRESLSALQLGSREKELEVRHLKDSFYEKYRLDLETQPTQEDPAFDPAVASRRQNELRRLIEGIGEVNLTAIEEYEELEERFSFLTTQQEDLRRSLQGLQEAIARINRTTRRRFKETFDQVNGKFQEVFPRLFRGGRAELRLSDEEDLLETGIDIIAQPPGKKLQNVTLLSGGEKALTAVALVFSIFMIKPSPFCLLDEVDAPLDDANIGRFNDIVREMSAISQFIIITHNRRTMEIAGPLYGVTMEEPGVSKLVSVQVNEVL
ncbi:MAG TPA: chromosome segregation protein SMC [Geothermobacteraceae bacterium]|nr:chromosome segregation protein SMC [Geothermobacteraceae bacterium]